MTESDRNLQWDIPRVRPQQRERLLGQRGAVLWLTGLSGSGKSTIARELERRLVGAGRLAYVLDGDNLRHGLNADLAFSPEDRAENVRRVGEVAALLADAGLLVIAAVISPYERDRAAVHDAAGRLVGEGRFLEIHLDVGVDVCEGRDPKGLYEKARRGEIVDFTGVSAPYEAPRAPTLRIPTGVWSVDESVKALLDLLRDRGFVRTGDATS